MQYDLADFKPYEEGDDTDRPVLVWNIESGYYFLPNAADGVLIVGVLK